MRSNFIWRRLAVLGAFLPVLMGSVQAQTYPSRPVQLIAPMAPGGGIDNLARYVSQKLSERLGQPVVVENRPGANGNIGANLVSRATPDGYILMTTYVGTQSINPSLYKNVGFDPVKDFDAVAPLAATPYVVVANASVPVRTMKDIVEYAKKNPGKLNYGSAGAGSVGHLAGKMFEQMTDTTLTHVPYKGSSPASIDLAAGRIQLMFNTVSTLGHLFGESGLRPIAIASKDRSRKLPDIPTSAEEGYKDFLVSTWYGIVAPKGTPKNIIARLNREINLILEEDDVKEWFAGQDYEPMHMSPEEFANFIEEERDRWNRIIVDGNVAID